MNVSSFVIAVAIALLLYLPIFPEFCGGRADIWALSHSHSSKYHRTIHSETIVNHSSRRREATTKSASNSRLHRSRHIASQSETRGGHKKNRHVAARTRYAYPMSIFLYEPPPFDLSPLPEEQSCKIRQAFNQGTAEDYSTRSLVKAHIVNYYPIRGGIFFRREPIKNIIMHSTEPGIPVGAKTVIDAWSHGGRRHAGAHYVVDRDGTIYQALDPDLAAVHINIFKTLPGFDNDNSVGIEMCHQGSQNYTPEQLRSVIKLVVYLQNHYHVPNSNIVTHKYAQQGDHTDPVNFAWNDFIADKASLQNQALNYRVSSLKAEALAWQQIEETDTGASKIYKGNKAVVVDLSKSNKVQTPSSKAAVIVPAATYTSAPLPDSPASSVPLSSISEPSVPSSPSTPSVSVPSAAAVNLVPITTGSVSRLVPATPTNIPGSSINRLVPPSFVVNDSASNLVTGNTEIKVPAINVMPGMTKSNTGGDNVDFSPIDEAVFSPNSRSSQGKKTLPLRGPIEMDPNEAASLLNENATSK